MIKKRRATIKDVATQAGFSVATVSRILNGENSFLPATQKKIWDIAHALGYEPSASARKLRAGVDETERTRTNLIMHILAIGSEDPMGDKDIAACIHSFDWQALQQGYFTTNYQYYRSEGFRCPLLLDRLIDGAVIGSPHTEVIRSVSQKVPTVLLNVGDSHLFPELHRVNPAVEDGMRQLLMQAYDLGHRSAAAIGAPEPLVKDESFAIRTLRKYVNLADEIGINIANEHRFQPVDLTPETHNRIMDKITDSLCQAIHSGKISLVICEEYVYTNTIVDFLKQKGIRIPEDVSVIGVNSSFTEIWNPTAVTSVVVNWKLMFQTTIRILDDLINGTSLPCREYRIATSINEGETLGAAPAHE